jgi:hypothetical protein
MYRDKRITLRVKRSDNNLWQPHPTGMKGHSKCADVPRRIRSSGYLPTDTD